MTDKQTPFHKPIVRLPGCMLAGALCMLAFTLSPTGYVGVSDPPLRAGSALWCLYALLLGGLFWLYTGGRRVRMSAGIALTGLLFGVVNYFATTLFAYDTWSFLSTARAWGVAALCVLGQGAAMAAGIALVCGWLERRPRHGTFAPGGNACPLAEIPASGGDARATVDAESGLSPKRAREAAPLKAAACHAASNPFGGLERSPTGVAPAAGGEDLYPATATADEVSASASGAVSQKQRLRRALRGWPERLVTRFPRGAAWLRRHPVLGAMAFLLLCWSPYLIVFYPGTIIWDMGEMLGMLYGLRDMTTWHPVFTTWLFGGCVGLGRLLGSDNLGAFLFTLLQTLAMAYALARAVQLLRALGLGRGWRIATLVFFGLTPIFGSFAQAVGKDTLYTSVLLLFTVSTIEVLRFGAPGKKELAAYALWALLGCLVRTNGLYVVAGTAVLVIAFGVRGRARLTVGGTLASALAVALLFTNGLLPALHIKDETASGLYSVCFQQSARVLRDHASDVTPAESAEIDLVLDAARLPALYEANISDPVKYTFRQYGQGRAAEAAALARYRRAWFSMLSKYPLTYLEAFVAGNSGYYAFTPKIDASRTFNYQGGIRFVFETYELGPEPQYLHTTQIAGLGRARELLAAYSRGWRRVPVLELALFCPVYTWLLVAAGLSLARRRRLRELIAFVPALLSLGVCLLSPVNDYFRYFLPIVAMSPVLLGLSARPGD